MLVTMRVQILLIGFGDLVEFDTQNKHYCVSLEKNSNFATFVGTWNE